MAKEELTVKVAEIDSIQIHNMNFTKASQDEVLQEFASNSTGSNHQNARLHELAGLNRNVPVKGLPL